MNRKSLKLHKENDPNSALERQLHQTKTRLKRGIVFSFGSVGDRTRVDHTRWARH